jgi:hypothetical protein
MMSKPPILQCFTLVFLSIIASFILAACSDNDPNHYPTYKLVNRTYTPDSLLLIKANWVTETVRASTNNLTTSDYEDVDDTIEETVHKSSQLFSRDEIVLIRQNSATYSDYIIIRENQMTPYEKKIFTDLRNGK